MLTQMSWRVIAVPKAAAFIATDNPFAKPQQIGLTHPRCLALFPISSDVAVLITWLDHPDREVWHATSGQVRALNWVALYSAQSYVFAARPEPWIVEAWTTIRSGAKARSGDSA